MEFSAKELLAIAAAKKKVKTATLFSIALIIAILCGILLMFSGVVLVEKIIHLVFAAFLLALVLLQIGPGPKYEEIIKILESRANVQRLKNITIHITRNLRQLGRQTLMCFSASVLCVICRGSSCSSS